MKSFLTKILISSLFLTSSVFCAEDSMGPSIHYHIATDNSFVPFSFKLNIRQLNDITKEKEINQAEYGGFDIELIVAIMKHLGATYTLHPMTFNGIMPALQVNKVDLAIAGIEITSDREAVLDFSDGYFQTGLTALVRKENKNINNFNELNGKVVAGKIGTAGVNYLKKNIKTKNLRLFTNIDPAIQEVALGRVSAFVHDKPNLAYFLTTEAGKEFKIIEETIRGGYFGIAFPKGSALKNKINDALKALKKNGTYEKIYNKWFNR